MFLKRGHALALFAALGLACSEQATQPSAQNELNAESGTGGQPGSGDASNGNPGGQASMPEDEAPPCEGLGAEECTANDSCELVRGSRLDLERECWEPLTPVSPAVCARRDQVCPDVASSRFSPDGDCWQLPASSCGGSREAWEGWGVGEGGQGGGYPQFECAYGEHYPRCP